MHVARAQARRSSRRLIDDGLFPYTRRYLGTLENHFSTIGVNGLHEMVRNLTGDRYGIVDHRGHALVVRLLDHVRARMVELQEATGHLYNLEATPAEGATYRFAKEDRRRFPGILQAGTDDHPYYTNSSQLPVGFTDDPFEALSRQDELQTKYTGGTVLHLYMAERHVDPRRVPRAGPARAVDASGCPYLTVTPTFSICPRHGYLAGRAPHVRPVRRRVARRRPCLRGLDAGHGLPPAGQLVQRRQAGRARRADRRSGSPCCV